MGSYRDPGVVHDFVLNKDTREYVFLSGKATSSWRQGNSLTETRGIRIQTYKTMMHTLYHYIMTILEDA